MILWGYFWVDKYGVERTLKSIFLGILGLSLLVTVISLWDPALISTSVGETRGRLVGFTVANVGVLAVMGLVLLLTIPVIRNRTLYLLCGGLFFYLLLVSRTRSAYAAIAIFVLFVFFRSPRLRSLRMLRTVVIISSPLMLLFFQPLSQWVIREPESLYSLSGRTKVWSYLTELVLTRSPLLGLGFNSERLYTIASTSVPHLSSHNAFISVFYGGGLVSLLTYFILLLGLGHTVFFLSLRLGHSPVILAVVGLLLVLAVTGLVSESVVMGETEGFTFYVLISITALLDDFSTSAAPV